MEKLDSVQITDQLTQEVKEKILVAYNDYKDGRYHHMLDAIEKMSYKNQHSIFLKVLKNMGCKQIIVQYIWSLYYKAEKNFDAFMFNNNLLGIIANVIDKVIEEGKEENKENDKLPFNCD